MRINFYPSAKKYLAKLEKKDPKNARNILARIGALAENPAPHGVCKMRGKQKNHLRIRVGDFRVVYFVEDEITITNIGPRPTIYRKHNRQ